MAKDRGPYTSTYHVMIETKEFERLSLHATALLWTLRHCPRNNRVGIFSVFREELAAWSKVPLEHVQGALRELEREKWIVMEGRWVWLRNHLKFDPHYRKENPKLVTGVMNTINGLPRLNLVDCFMSYYIAAGLLPGVSWNPAQPEEKVESNQTPISGATESNPVAVSVAIAVTGTVTATNGLTDSAADAAPPAKSKPWTSEAIDDWREHLGDTKRMAGRIAAELKPVVDEHGWPAIRPLWVEALQEAALRPDPATFAPDQFTRTIRARLARRNGQQPARASPHAQERERGLMASTSNAIRGISSPMLERLKHDGQQLGRGDGAPGGQLPGLSHDRPHEGAQGEHAEGGSRAPDGRAVGVRRPAGDPET